MARATARRAGFVGIDDQRTGGSAAGSQDSVGPVAAVAEGLGHDRHPGSSAATVEAGDPAGTTSTRSLP